MIKEIFDSDSADAILTIPIPSNPKQDKMIWLPNLKGNFSVKSVHKVAYHNVNNNDQAQSHWKKLWKAKLPERLKMLLWRIGANAMPNKVNLQRRIQHTNTSCSLCNSNEETNIHLFFLCPFAKALWTTVGWGLRIDSSSLSSNEDIVKLITNPPHAPIPTEQRWTITLNMALIIDEIWKSRNHLIFQGGLANVNKAMSNVRIKFLEASKVFSPSIHPSLEPPILIWSPPPQGWIKINVVAAMSNSKSALAVIARNH